MASFKSVAQGEQYWGATYLKGLTSKNHFVVLDPSRHNDSNISMGMRLEGVTSLKSCFFSILFNNISPFLIVCPTAKSSQPAHGYHLWRQI